MGLAVPQTREAETARTPSTPSRDLPEVLEHYGVGQPAMPTPQGNGSSQTPLLPGEGVGTMVVQYHRARHVVQAVPAAVARHPEPPAKDNEEEEVDATTLDDQVVEREVEFDGEEEWTDDEDKEDDEDEAEVRFPTMPVVLAIAEVESHEP
ncbi:hypothetical protein Taro_002981 [Colocasia esculenta]|uniref:Uncharacterized protein n=1 Tax=Colocasia esculenta TaxID=4460 RepID=A0A843TKU9_COLES|nr:hypothetical protein [Colocasia esculenta]